MSTGQWAGAGIGAILGGIIGSIIPGVGTVIGALYGASLGYMVGGYIDPVKPDVKQPGAPKVEGIQVMSNIVGNPIYDLIGTGKITGQLLFFGAERVKKIRVKVDSSYAVKGYKYYASWAVGICLGDPPVDVLYSIFKDQDPIWEGELTRPESGGEAEIEIPDMGIVTFYFGTDDQVSNVNAGLIIPDETLNTGYRHLCWAFFNDFFMNEYNRMPSMTFVLRKNPALFADNTKQIQAMDTNPAHAIWFVLAKKAGLPEEWLHTADFTEVAQALFDENRGISMVIDTYQSAVSYLDSINSHVDNILRFGSDGKFHPKLIRDDYTPGDLIEISPSSLVEEPSFQRRSWIDTINEIKVQYSEIVERPWTPLENYIYMFASYGSQVRIEKFTIEPFAYHSTILAAGIEGSVPCQILRPDINTFLVAAAGYLGASKLQTWSIDPCEWISTFTGAPQIFYGLALDRSLTPPYELSETLYAGGAHYMSAPFFQKIRYSDMTSLTTLPSLNSPSNQMVIDEVDGYIYYASAQGGGNYTGAIGAIRLVDFVNMGLVDTPAGVGQGVCMAIDRVNKRLYVSYSRPSPYSTIHDRIYRYSYNGGVLTSPVYISLGASTVCNQFALSGDGDYLYFGVIKGGNSNEFVYKVRTSDMTVVASLEIVNSSNLARVEGIVLDEVRGDIYFGRNQIGYNCAVYKVRISDWTLQGTLQHDDSTLPYGVNALMGLTKVWGSEIWQQFEA
jgi:hypothetical protein